MNHSLIITSLCLAVLTSNFVTKSKVDSKEYDEYLAHQMLSVLQKTDVEPADRVQIARRFGLVSSVPDEIPAIPVWEVGMERSFWVINTDTSETLETEAIIQYIGEHIVCWVEREAIAWITEDFFSELNKFDQALYPYEFAVFGSELSPGVDHDPLIHVLFTGKTGANILGYFSSRDEDPVWVSAQSNAMELFILNTSLMKNDVFHITNTLAHEYQHMIHFAHDQNEGSAIDEGLSGLAEYLVNTRVNTIYEQMYLSNPDKSLTNWPVTDSGIPYYGGSFLFFKYITDRMGIDFIKKIVQQPENNLDGIDASLEAYSGNDEEINADDLFSDWIITNLAGMIAHPFANYHYNDYELPIRSQSDAIQPLNCSNRVLSSDVMQYGVDYFKLICPEGSYQIKFSGEEFISMINRKPISGNYSWWSNAVNNSETTLQREFDFRSVKAGEEILLEYDIDFSFEDQFDFLYVSYSEDDGMTWKNFITRLGSDQNHSGFNLGWGYTGNSNGVQHEIIDLSSFAGKKISIRFDYITDQALVADGALIDNIRVEAINFYDDAESNQSNWKSSGFLRLYNQVPQPYLNFFLKSTSEDYEVEILRVDRGEPMVFHCNFDVVETKTCYFGVSAINRYASQKADYKIEITREK